jgi:cytochrome c
MLFVSKVVTGFAQGKNDLADRGHLQHDHYVELTKVPEKARVRHNPFEGDLNAIAAGKKLFEQHCAECHGSSAEGSKKAPSLRAEEVHTATPGTLFWILTNGVVRRGMPVWSKLPEPQRWQIVSFLKSLDASSGVPQIPIDRR